MKMNREDYFKYYIQGSDHYLIPKDVFIELFDEMVNWREDTQKYKEVIEKIKTRYIDYYGTTKEVNDNYVLRNVLKEISDLLKEVE